MMRAAMYFTAAPPAAITGLLQLLHDAAVIQTIGDAKRSDEMRERAGLVLAKAACRHGRAPRAPWLADMRPVTTMDLRAKTAGKLVSCEIWPGDKEDCAEHHRGAQANKGPG